MGNTGSCMSGMGSGFGLGGMSGTLDSALFGFVLSERLHVGPILVHRRKAVLTFLKFWELHKFYILGLSQIFSHQNVDVNG